MSGKGSKPRPYSVPMDRFASEYERIFGDVLPNLHGSKGEAGQGDGSGDVQADIPEPATGP